MKKKISLLMLSICVSLLMISQSMPSTGADFTSKDKVELQHAIGNLSVSVIDEEVVSAIRVLEEVKRPISVINTGEVNQMVRLFVQPVYVSKKGFHEVLSTDELVQDLNTIDWKKGEDGFYYYLGKLAAGEETPALFKKIRVPKRMSEGALTLNIKAEVSVANKVSYQKAWWQGATPEASNTELVAIDGVLSGLAD